MFWLEVFFFVSLGAAAKLFVAEDNVASLMNWLPFKVGFLLFSCVLLLLLLLLLLPLHSSALLSTDSDVSWH